MRPGRFTLRAASGLALGSLGIAAMGQAPAIDASQMFAAKCAACHSAGGWGTRTLARRVPPDQAELLRRQDLNATYIRFVVRHGIGSMPQFTPTDLSDGQLRTLGEWLASKTRARPAVTAQR